MKKYGYIFMTQFQTMLEYKFHLITSLFSNFLTIIISFYIWQSVYMSSGKGVIGGYTQAQMLKYIILVNFLSIVFSFDYVVRLGGLIRSGKLSTLLLRPISLLGESFFNFLGTKILYIFFLLLSLCFLGSTSFLLVFLYFLVVFVLFFLVLSAIGTVGFWLIQMWPLRPVLSGLYALLGGLFFPLNLLPQSIYQIVMYNPFALIGYHTANIFQNHYSTEKVLFLTLISLIWAALFYVLYVWGLKKGLKKYEGMGA